MSKIKRTHLFHLILCFSILITGLQISGAAEKAAFTVSDSLKIKSFSASAMTDDGRYIAGSISQRIDRLGTDHKRFGDPTYISPRVAEFVILDTETGQMRPLYKSKVQVQSMTWSPDGQSLAFFLREEGDRFLLHVYSLETDRIRKIKLNSNKQIASSSFLIWKKNEKGVLLALRSNEWTKNSRASFEEATVGPITIYDSSEPFLKWDSIRNLSSLMVPAAVDLKSGDVTELLPEERYSGVRLSGDDSFITYSITYPLKTSYDRKDGTEYELYRFDLKEGGEPQILINRGAKRLRPSWNEENTLFAWADEGDIFIQSVDETEPRNLTKDKVKPEKDNIENKEETADKKEEKDKKEKKVRFSLNRFSPDGRKLLAQTDKGYWVIDHESAELEMVFPFPKKPEEGGPKVRRPGISAWTPDGRFLYMTYAETDRWERGFTRFDLQTKKSEVLLKDTNLYRGLRMSKDGRKFFYSFSTGDLPNEYVVTDKNFKQKRQLMNLNPWVAERKLTRSELVKYLDVDGNELYGILYYPVDYEEGKKYPLVCEIYEKFFDNGFNTNMNILTEKGWFGLRPSVNLEMGYPGESWVKGVTSVINKLIERGIVDSKKLGVHGTSYGGYASSLLITQTDRFAAAANISGKVNMISFLADSPRIGTRNYAAAEVGQDRIGPTLWEAPFKYINHSAVMFADRVKTPHLLITGEGDWNVPAGNTREMYYALRRLGKECVWVNYYNDGHGMGAAESEAIYLDKWKRLLDWYEKYFTKADKKKGEGETFPLV